MDFKIFKWLNKSQHSITDNKITITAPANTDYFNSPVPENGQFKPPQGNAPFFYTQVEGDFVAKVKVTPNSTDTYDAACLMVMEDQNLWIKAAYEKSDFDTQAVVSVVTNQVSDDANGCNIVTNDCDPTDTHVWLQIARVGNNFAVHYSLDGEKFDMVRLCFLPVSPAIKVGIEAQAPMGEGGIREFENFTIENRTISNLRAGK